jgi:hypothetical protein
VAVFPVISLSLMLALPPLLRMAPPPAAWLPESVL